MMKITLFIAMTLAVTSPASALPFGTKSPDGGTEKQEMASVRGAAKEVSRSQTPEASAVVESFFESSDSGSLQETLHALSNADGMHDFLQSTRRSLHRHPEVMYELPFTSNTIAGILDELDIAYTRGWSKNTHPEVYEGQGGYGIVADIGSKSSEEPCIILRADMDALPILEAVKGIDGFKSMKDGQMHACVHDGHTTMLLGAAALLKKIESQIVGTVRLVFQPAEEGGAGMKRMVEEGVHLMEPKAQLGFGMHVWPTLPTGIVASRPGALMAAAEMFQITLTGKGGHAAMPHQTVDPIVAAASLISSLQTIVSRTLSPLESGVISVTAISAGDAFNVIPGDAVLKGTIRALSTETLLSLRDKVQAMVESTALLHGCNSTITYSPDYYPPTFNDAELFEWTKDIGALISRDGKLRDVEPTMGGEDFSFLAEVIPTTFFFIGQGTGGDETHHIPRTDFGLHHPSFALDEDVLPIGVELHANLALRSLKRLAEEGSDVITKAEL